MNSYIIKWESIQERLAEIQGENMLFQQQLEDTQKKTMTKEKFLSESQVLFIDLLNIVWADTEKLVLTVE